MQSEAEAVAAAESCTLADAERHMRGPAPLPVMCGNCIHFHRFSSEDKWQMVMSVPEGMENRLNVCRAVCEELGVCDLHLDDLGGMVYAPDFMECSEDDGYEERVC